MAQVLSACREMLMLISLFHQCDGALCDCLSYTNAHSQNTTVIMPSLLSFLSLRRFKV